MKTALAMMALIFLSACSHMGMGSCSCCNKDKAATQGEKDAGDCKTGACKKP